LEKLIVSGDQDIWYLSGRPQGLSLSLLLATKPVKNVSLLEVVLDRAGNPHLLLEKKGETEYYYWNGSSWFAGAKPLLSRPGKFFLAFRDNRELHLLVNHEEGTPRDFTHLYLKDNIWYQEEISLIPRGAKIQSFLNWPKDGLTLIYKLEAPIENSLGIIHYDGHWKNPRKLNLGGGRLLNCYPHTDALLLLAGEGTLEGCIFVIYTVPLAEPENSRQHVLGRVKGCEGSPTLFFSRKGVLNICWNYRGRIYLANVDTKTFDLLNLVESDIFYPAEFISLTGPGNLPGLLALKKIHGTSLDFPAVMTVETLEMMIKGRSIASSDNMARGKMKCYRQLQNVRPSRS
jgi:hypothetical protein